MPSPASSVRDQIVTANRRFEAAYRSGDPAAVARLYTEQARLMASGAESVTGREGIAKFWRGVMDLGIRRVRLETEEVEDHGSTTIETGHYTLFGEGDHQLDRGKYVVVWKLTDGDWKLHWDIWNSSVPPRN